MNDRWASFRQVITNPLESRKIIAYRPTFIKDPVDRTQKESVEYLFDTLGLWIYPEEQLEHFIDGKILKTEVIFLMLPETFAVLNDLLFKLDENKFYRIIGINDLLSHKEYHCVYVDKSKLLGIKVPSLAASTNIASGSISSLSSRVRIV